ncbi:MAG: hypothetical protein P4L99_11605 [Chthoniobacter sp.]|nr:hypothetical protein [Chthoniobacter sp.]
MKPSPRIGLWCALALSLNSCAQHYVLTSPAQTEKLPANRGWYGGSMWVVSPWEYRGSKARTHEFYFYHNDQNFMERCTVSIPREDVVLHLSEHAFGATPVWMDLHPDGKKFQFYATPDSPPRR